MNKTKMKRLSINLKSIRRSKSRTGDTADPHVPPPHSASATSPEPPLPTSPPSAGTIPASQIAPTDNPSPSTDSSNPPLNDDGNGAILSSTLVTKTDYWQLAIDALQAEDVKHRIKQRITAIQQEAASSGNSDFVTLLLQKTQQSQQDVEAKRWKITTGPWKINVRQQFDRTIKFLQIFKELSQPAYNVDPIHVGLPLAGLCVLMQLAISDSEQYAGMLKGVADIVVILTTYREIEALYLTRPTEDLTQPLEQHLIGLYKHTIRYQISAINYYQRNTMDRFVRAIPKMDDVSDIMTEVHREDAACRRIIDVLDTSDATKRHQELFQRIDELEKNLAKQATTEPVEPKWPVHWTVARSPNALFTGRDDVLHELETAVKNALDETRLPRQSRSLIFGLGGQGKSEICLQLVQRIHHLFWGIFWVDVSTPLVAENAFLDIGKRLTGSAATWQDGCHALANSQKPWILVLDNADDPNVDCQDYFPSSARGVVLMTSRNKENQQYVTDKTIALEGLPLKDAQELLFKSAGIEENEKDAVQEDSLKVAELLQSHPLALTLAGAFVRSGHCTFGSYPDQFQRQRRRLLQFKARQAKSRYADVYATFEASIEILEKSEAEASRDALELLPALAVCAPTNFPLQLLEMAWTGARRVLVDDDVESTRLGQWHVDRLLPLIGIDAGEWDAYRLMEAVRLLEAFALLSTDRINGQVSVSMHPLVHAWARDRQDDHSQHTSWVKMGCIMATSADEDQFWIRRELQLRPHIQSLMSWNMESMFASDPPTRIACVLQRCGSRLDAMRDDVQLSKHLDRLFAHLGISQSTVEERWLGLYALRASNQLDCGQVRQAITLWEQIITLGRQNLSETDTDRLASQHQLARAYLENGQVRDAISLLEHIVTIKERILLEHHPDRLASQHQLASAYLENGQVREAISLLEHIVTVKERTLPEDHPYRLASQHGLASAYLENGQVRDAISLLEHIVTIEGRTLINDHLDRLASQHGLASAYLENGQVREAISLLEHIVTVKERTLPEDHPSRLASQHGLASAYLESGQVREVISLLENVVTIQERTLLEDHPSRLASQHELARAYSRNKQVEEGLSLQAKVVQIEAKTLREDHPSRLSSEHQLAILLWHSGRTREGCQLMEHVVQMRERVLSENHPDLAYSKRWLKDMEDEMRESMLEAEIEIDCEPQAA